MRTDYLQKELDFLKLLVTRFQEQEKISGLELDIALQKTQEIYEELLKIKLTPVVSAAEKKAKEVHKKEEIQPEERPVTDVCEKSPENVQSIPAEPKESIVEPEKIKDVVPSLDETQYETKTEVSVPEDKKIKPKQPESGIRKTKADILAEKVRVYQPINETLAQTIPATDLSSKWQTVPLNSIASGIGLNDKFLYVRELFDGNNELYNTTIQHLDAASSLNEALGYVHRNFKWNQENETVQKFIHLIYRRHGKIDN
jgi:hypothetical protein